MAFQLIEQRFQRKTLEQVQDLKQKQKDLTDAERENNLQGRIDLANYIDAITNRSERPETADLKDIRETRKRERERTHVDILGKRKANK